MTTNNTTYKKLTELTLDELKALYDHNCDFASELDSEIYDTNLCLQGEEYDNIFGKGNETVSYHNHYSSFYLRVSDAEKFVKTIDKDYLSLEGLKLYEICDKLADKWAEMDYDEQQSDEGEKVFAELEQKSGELLQIIENELHDYEQISEDQVETVLTLIADGYHRMSNWKTDGAAVYEEIVKIYR